MAVKKKKKELSTTGEVKTNVPQIIRDEKNKATGIITPQGPSFVGLPEADVQAKIGRAHV